MIRPTLIVVSALLICLPARGRCEGNNYDGADGGYLIYSTGMTGAAGAPFFFRYGRTLSPDGHVASDWKGRIFPRYKLFARFNTMENPDFAGEETGQINVRRLPPGHYEVSDFSFAGSIPSVVIYTYSTGIPFSIPFDVRSGEATYIGTFMRLPSLKTSLQPILGAAGFFVIADRSERDLPIAKGKLPTGIKIPPKLRTYRNSAARRFEQAALERSRPGRSDL